jgi:hypothetical protein
MRRCRRTRVAPTPFLVTDGRGDARSPCASPSCSRSWDSVFPRRTRCSRGVVRTGAYRPGSADLRATTGEWVRDHGGGPLVDVVENWWYARNRPSGDAPAPGNVPTAVAAPQPPSAPDPRGARPPSLPLLRGVPPLADEATWVPDAGAIQATPTICAG